MTALHHSLPMVNCASSPDKWDEGISVIIPTFQRPDGLAKTLNAVLNQDLDKAHIEVLVADNDPAGGAKGFVRSVAQSSKWPVHYIHVPEPGVSNARNAAIAQAQGRYIAWIDDDQIPRSHWLATYLATSQRYGAALTFCPTHAVIDNNDADVRFYRRFFSRAFHSETGKISKFYGCGNSFLDRTRCRLPDPIFDPIANETGGEDDLLYSAIQEQGAVMAWTSETSVDETIPAWRSTPAYVRKRSFGFGQGPSRIAANLDTPDVIGLAKWTLIGIGQALVYGSLAIGATAVGHWSALKLQCRAMEGLGKVFWHEPFRPKLYGAPKLVLKERLLEQLSPRAATRKALPRPNRQQTDGQA